LDIPPSPPGSPDPAANAKFEHFSSLKKQGVHFNSKLASSSSLKNPSLLMKMMVHAGVDERSQYNTALPAELWSTSDLPEWGYKEELLKVQQEIRQSMEEKKVAGQRSSLEFVPGSTANTSRSSSSEAKRKGYP
jgi:HCNGP-like protein